jgi:NADPH:quinone reductase
MAATVRGKAAIFKEYGEPKDMLHIEEREYKPPKFWQIRVRVTHRPINPSDMMTVRGLYGQRPALPATPGYEGLGVIEEVGALWRPLRKKLIGTRVNVGGTNPQNGTWQEYVYGVPYILANPVPSGIPDEQAAMMFVNPASALIMTRHVLKVPKGAWLLQTAAGSALGQCVIKLGQIQGFKTINVVRRRSQADELLALGADKVIATDEDDLVAKVNEITGGKGVLYAIEAVGGETANAVAKSLGKNGRMLIYGRLGDNNDVTLDVGDMIFKTPRVEGFWLSTWFTKNSFKFPLILRQLHKLMLDGKIHMPVSRTFDLSEIKEAVEYADTAARGGKVLLKSF